MRICLNYQAPVIGGEAVLTSRATSLKNFYLKAGFPDKSAFRQIFKEMKGRALERWMTVQGGHQRWAVARRVAAPWDPYLI